MATTQTKAKMQSSTMLTCRSLEYLKPSIVQHNHCIVKRKTVSCVEGECGTVKGRKRRDLELYIGEEETQMGDIIRKTKRKGRSRSRRSNGSCQMGSFLFWKEETVRQQQLKKTTDE